MRVSTVSGRKHTRHIRARTITVHDDVPFRITRQEILEQFGIGMVTDSQEESVDVDVADLFERFSVLVTDRTFAVNQVCSLYFSFTGQSQGVMLKEHFYLRVIQHALLHDLRGTQIGFAHDHIYFLAQAG